MKGHEALLDRIRALRARATPVLPFDPRTTPVTVFDLGPGNAVLASLDLGDVDRFTRHIFDELARNGTPLGVGRYGEERIVYRHRSLFAGEAEPRSVHLGIDLFVEPGTPVFSPLPAKVHSLADNDRPGDYGPTVILEHRVDGLMLFTLYGHLGRGSLRAHRPGSAVAAGGEVGRVGKSRENGGWPPHLHFQLITEMGDLRGDFPGVAAPSLLGPMLRRCPDPNLLLGIPSLDTEE